MNLVDQDERRRQLRAAIEKPWVARRGPADAVTAAVEDTPLRPAPLRVCVEDIPDALKVEHRWVVWHYVWKAGTNGKPGKWDKPPAVATATSKGADSTNPTTWRSFAEAIGAYEDGKCDGVGFVLGDGWIGFDADDTDAQDFVRLLNTYTERSPSGKGVHAIMRGAKPGKRRAALHREAADERRTGSGVGHDELVCDAQEMKTTSGRLALSATSSDLEPSRVWSEAPTRGHALARLDAPAY